MIREPDEIIYKDTGEVAVFYTCPDGRRIFDFIKQSTLIKRYVPMFCGRCETYHTCGGAEELGTCSKWKWDGR